MKRFLDYVFVVICMLCMAGCQNEDVPEEVTETAKEPGLYLCLNTVGGGNGFSTRTMPDDENSVKTLNVLYFKGQPNADDEFFTLVKNESVIISSAQSIASDYVFKLKPGIDGTLTGGNVWKVVFIANMVPTVTEGSTTLKALKETPQVVNSKVLWQGTATDLTPNSAYIPMYYCTGVVALPDPPYDKIYYINDVSTNTTSQTHKLYRMMAKFTINNVKQATLTAELSNFEIGNITVMNGYMEGLVCYQISNWSTPQNRVHSPTLPSTTPTPTNSSPVSLSPWNDNKQDITFYTFERDASEPNINNIAVNCYIKLVGTRTDLGGTITANVNYMLPIYDITYSSGACTPNYNKSGPILRNHHYIYTINGVHLYSLRASLQVAPWDNVPIAADPIPLR